MENCLEFSATSQQSNVEPMSRQIGARNISRTGETLNEPLGQNLLIEVDFDTEALRMGWHAPIVRRKVAKIDLFEAERGSGEIFRTIIDRMHVPVVIVSADMQILFANISAEKMFKDDEVICSRMGRLDFKFRLAGNEIKLAVATSKKDECMLGPSGINLPLLRAQIPTVAHVMPLARCDHPRRNPQEAAAAIFIATAGNSPVPAIDAIGALFGLTPAEKNVAAHIVAGRRAAEISKLNDASENTVRSHIRALFDKTRTRDQRDLITLIKELTPPVSGSLCC